MIINLKKKLMGKSARKPCYYNAKPPNYNAKPQSHEL